MKINKKFLIILLVILFVLSACLAGGTYYLNKILFPTIVKERLVSDISEITHTPVEIEAVSFDLFRGMVISGLSIGKLSTIKEVSATFLIIPFLKNKKIILPSVRLYGLNIWLKRQKDASYNLSYILENLKNQTPAQKIPILLIKEVYAIDSTMHFTDETFEKPFSADLAVSRLFFDISLTQAKFNVSAQIITSGEKSDITSNGNYAFASGEITGNILLTNLNLLNYNEYLLPLPIAIKSGHFKQIKLNFISDGKNIKSDSEYSIEKLDLKQNGATLKNAALNGTLTWKTVLGDFKQSTYNGKVTISEANINTSDYIKSDNKLNPSTIEFSVDSKKINLNAQLDILLLNAEKNNLKFTDFNIKSSLLAQIPIIQDEDLKLSYSSSINLTGSELSGLPTIGTLNNITAEMELNNSTLTIKNALVKCLGTTIAANGTLTDNILNLNISGDFDLNKLKILQPKNLILPHYEINGVATIKANLKTDITRQADPFVKAEAILKDMSVKLNESKLQFSANNGLLICDTEKEKLDWHFDVINFKNSDYSFNGGLKNFKMPSVAATIIGKGIKIIADVNREENAWNINSLTTNFKNSKLEISGKINDQEGIHLSTTTNLNISDINNINPTYGEKIEKIGLVGVINFHADISGPLKKYNLWNVTALGSSEKIKCSNLTLTDIKLDYKQIQNQGYINSLKFKAYSGYGEINGSLDLKDKNIAYNLRATLENIELGELKKDTTLKDKDFYGQLSLKLSLQGRTDDINNLTGDGEIAIAKGNVWEFNPLQGLGNFIFLPRFKNITFTDATGDFTIADSLIKTDNLELFGPEMGLIAEGSISFKGDLDLIVNTQTTSTKDMKSAFSKAESLTAVKITGNVSKPKYAVQAIGENIIKKLGDLFSNIVP